MAIGTITILTITITTLIGTITADAVLAGLLFGLAWLLGLGLAVLRILRRDSVSASLQSIDLMIRQRERKILVLGQVLHVRRGPGGTTVRTRPDEHGDDDATDGTGRMAA